MPAAINLMFIQPFAISIGLPIAALGVIALGIRLFQVAGATSAGRVVKRLGEWNLLKITPLILFVGLFAIGGLNSWLGVVIYSMSGFATAATIPTVESIINRQAPGTVRATIFSIDSLIFKLLAVFLEPGIGLVADAHGLSTAFIAMALLFGCMMPLVLLGWRKVYVPVSQKKLKDQHAA